MNRSDLREGAMYRAHGTDWRISGRRVIALLTDQPYRHTNAHDRRSEPFKNLPAFIPSATKKATGVAVAVEWTHGATGTVEWMPGVASLYGLIPIELDDARREAADAHSRAREAEQRVRREINARMQADYQAALTDPKPTAERLLTNGLCKLADGTIAFRNSPAGEECLSILLDYVQAAL